MAPIFMHKRTITWPIFILLVLLVACRPSGPKLEVTDSWGRTSPRAAANAAFYMTLHNEGGEMDKLVGAHADECRSTMLHETVIDEAGVMSMEHVADIEIPAGETVALEVGGLHIMCLDKKSEFVTGDKIPLTLSFATSDDIMIEVEIREQ